MNNLKSNLFWMLALISITASAATVVYGADPVPSPAVSAPAAESGAAPAKKSRKKSSATAAAPTKVESGSAFEGEQVNIDAIKERYWARGEESEIGVVQNRLYRKEHKFELGVFYGSSSTDPFISVRELGATLGYHLTEYWAINAIYMNSSTSDSSATTAYLSSVSGSRPPMDPPKSYIGGEVQFSPLYGKLSVLGKKIIYYDLHLLAGGGVRQTNYGNYGTFSVGIGQQIYLEKWLALRVDYRMLAYKDTPHTILLNTAGAFVRDRAEAERSNFTHTITVGFSFLFDVFGGSKPSPSAEAAGEKSGEKAAEKK